MLQLQAPQRYPAVSILMNTTPAQAMTPPDRARLRALVDQAGSRLRAEEHPAVTEVICRSLERLAAQADAGPTSQALTLFASAQTATALRLPVAVVDRTVVDPTFATRDVVRALHRTPRHAILALTSGQARLFVGGGEGIAPVRGGGFPMRATPIASAPDRPRLPAARSQAFLREVDRALGAWLRQQPSPLVLVGHPRTLAIFMDLSVNLHRLAGTVEANAVSEPLPALARRTAPVLERYLLSREAEALDLLERRLVSSQVASGMSAAWLAARHEPVEMLAVEQGLFFPARLSVDGDLLIPADDVEHPDVVDDAVDELIETVIARGGWVALVSDGALAAHEGVAVTLRGR